MTAGRLQCLGGQQHLKSKYGGGYTLELRVADGAGAAVQAAVPSLFPGAVLEAAHAGKLRYEVAMEGVTLARIFMEVMEAQTAQLGVLGFAAIPRVHLPQHRRERYHARALTQAA